MRTVVILAGVAALAAGCASTEAASSGGGASSPPRTTTVTPPPPAPLRIRSGPVALEMPAALRSQMARGGDLQRRAVAAKYLQRHTSVGGARWTIRVAWSPSSAGRLAAAIANGPQRSVVVPGTVSAVNVTLPAIRQVYRNDCEATALSMALRGRVSQLRLQSELPIAQPYLPVEGSTGMVWGNPELGFVGDVRGGGYGVYDRPVLRLARRYDPGAENLTGTTVASVVSAVRHGRPVVAWIQFGASSPRTWHSPAGALVQANGAEHAVTLTGWRPGVLTYNNPWTGTRESFTVAAFVQLWHTLGDRAVALSSLIGRA